MEAEAAKRQAALASLVGGIVVLSFKLGGFAVSSSTAILSDALESTVNVAAAAMLLFSVALAARPADRDHPYGHGKAELFSAAVEGAAIVIAAAWIVLEAARVLWQGPELQQLELGLALMAAAGMLNLALGLYVVRIGRRTDSLALVADGKHLLADVVTTAGVFAGLVAAGITGLAWLDPLIALAVAALLLRSGTALVRDAVRGLMDEADPETLGRIADALEEQREPGWVDVHSLRAWRSGSVHHVDLHLVVPRYYQAVALHGLVERLERRVLEAAQLGGELIVHFDPCQPHECSGCDLADCAIRSHDFQKRAPITAARATRADPPFV